MINLHFFSTWVFRFILVAIIRITWWFMPHTLKQPILDCFSNYVITPSKTLVETILLKVSYAFSSVYGVYDAKALEITILLTAFFLIILCYIIANAIIPVSESKLIKSAVNNEKNKHYELGRSAFIVLLVFALLFVALSLRLTVTSFLLDPLMPFDHFVGFVVLLLLSFVFKSYLNNYCYNNALKKACVLQTLFLSVTALLLIVMSLFFNFGFSTLLSALLIASLGACVLSFAINDLLINNLITNISLAKSVFLKPYASFKLNLLQQERLITAAYYNAFIAFLSTSKFCVMVNLWLKPCLLEANYAYGLVLLLMLLVHSLWLVALKKFIQTALLYASTSNINVCVPFVPGLMFLRSIVPLIELIYESWQHYSKTSKNVFIALLNTFAHPVYLLDISDVLLMSITQRPLSTIVSIITSVGSLTGLTLGIREMGRIYNEHNYTTDIETNAPKIISLAKETNDPLLLEKLEAVETNLQQATLLHSQDRINALNNAKMGSSDITTILLEKQKCSPINWSNYKSLSTRQMVELLEQCSNK